MPLEPHNRIIRDVAREVLAPLGLTQKGRSRIWLDDHGWWATIVEFQPSGYCKASYLNVGIHWMWSTMDAITYSVGGRESEGASFRSEEQFTEAVNAMARIAAAKVRRYRSLCRSQASAARFLMWRPALAYDIFGDEWDLYNAAIAGGLARRVPTARFYFRMLLRRRVQHQWQADRRETAMELARLLGDARRFRKRIAQMVRDHRATVGLPEWPNPLFDDIA